MKEVYLVVEYDNGLFYLPFKNLECVDYFTVAFDNLIDLATYLTKILDLNIPKKEILDVYLADHIDKVNNDNNEYNKRYLAVKYSKDNFIMEDVKNKFAEYLSESIKRVDKYPGLHQVFMNYMNKYHKKTITKEDIKKIATLYLGNTYQRYKDFYFRYKDKGYKFRIKETSKKKYSKKELEQIEKDNTMLLIMFTNMNLTELSEYVNNQLSKGMHR